MLLDRGGILSLLAAKRLRPSRIERWLIILGVCKSPLMTTLHQQNSSWRQPFRVAFALFCLATGFLPCGNAASSGRWPGSSAQVTSQFAIADFDGDSRPDLATVQVAQSGLLDTRYWIRFHLSTGLRQTVGVTAPAGGLQITSRDVNGDTFLDVIITTAWTNRPVAVLLNDGRGNFTSSDPSAFKTAFSTSETSWICTTCDITDAVALLLSRNVSGNCEEASKLGSRQNATGLLAPLASHRAASALAVSFLGRAPPFLASSRINQLFLTR